MNFVDVINRSSLATDDELARIVAAVQEQVSHDLVPFWGSATAAAVTFVGKQAEPDTSHLKLWIKDHSDEDGDLGYHEDDAGTPEGFVFAADDAKYDCLLSVTVSHEIIEMLVDPLTTREATIGGVVYVVEAADAVESDEDGYDGSGGVRLSNFVTPRYFGLSGPAASDPRFDFRGLLKAGCPTMRPGGYCLWSQAGQWHSTYARGAGGSLSPRALRSARLAWRARRAVAA